MDVDKLMLEGEWLELQPKSKKISEPFRFFIKPLDSKEQIDLGKAAEKDIKNFLDKIEDVVLDWNMKKGGVDLPCTKESKHKYFPVLIIIPVLPQKKDESEEDEDNEGEAITKKPENPILGFEVLKFAQNIENFIKN